jgi:hypothetical protein
VHSGGRPRWNTRRGPQDGEASGSGPGTPTSNPYCNSPRTALISACAVGSSRRQLCAGARMTAAPRPGRARPVRRPPCLRWSARYRAAASGAVSAGSNPAGGAGRPVNSNTITIKLQQHGWSVTCANAQGFRSLRPAGGPRSRRLAPKPAGQHHRLITARGPLPLPQAVALAPTQPA